MNRKKPRLPMTKPKQTARQKKAQETRKALFDHAIRLFREKGFNNVNVDEITFSASTAKGTFYTYFKSKDDVIVQHYSQIDEAYVREKNALPEDLPVREKILRIFNVGLRFISGLGFEFSSVVFVHQLSQRDKPKAMLIQDGRHLRSIVFSFIEEGRSRGELRTDLSAEKMFNILTCLLHGICMDWSLAEGTYDLTEYGMEKFRFVLDCMATPEN